MSKNECVEKPALKLYVLDESSGNPDDWVSPEPSLVVAESAEGALSRWSWLGITAVEVVFTKPILLRAEPDPRDNL